VQADGSVRTCAWHVLREQRRHHQRQHPADGL